MKSLVQRLVVFILFLFLPAGAFTVDLASAAVGDFIVYAYKQQMTFLRIAKVEDDTVMFEEISGPRREEINWSEWLKNKAPGHTSWTLTTLKKGETSSIFSIDERRFLPKGDSFQLLPTLLKLTLEPVDASNRKRVGPEPLAGEVDFRPLWLPKIIFEGKEIHPPITVFHVLWPRDASELSQKPFDLYFAAKPALTYLPYWIEIHASISKIKIEAIDSGKELMNNLPTAFVDNHTPPKIP